MSAPVEEPTRADPEAPAAVAIAIAVGLAEERSPKIREALRAWLAGRFDALATIDFLANWILATIWGAALGGASQGGREFNRPPVLRPLEAESQALVTRAVETIISEESLRDFQESEADFEKSVAMRLDRLVKAESIAAARVGYADVGTEAIGEDEEDWIWQFETDADPCTRCIALARKVFASAEEAPKQGGHPNCECVLSPRLKESK